MPNGILSHSMRANYAEHGVSEYYMKVGKSYRNPHFIGVQACLFDWLTRWWKNEKQLPFNFEPITVFDMACGKQVGGDEKVYIDVPDRDGSGEATICVLQWYQTGIQQYKHSQEPNDRASNQRPPISRQKKTQNQHAELDERFFRPTILASDPFTAEAYADRTKMSCSPLSFRDIAEGALPPTSNSLFSETSGEGQKHDTSDTDIRKVEMVICSFALHLVESTSELFSLLWELSTKAKWLVVLTPHKKPEIKAGWGWTKWNVNTWDACQMSESSGEIVKERTHCRIYRSLNF